MTARDDEVPHWAQAWAPVQAQVGQTFPQDYGAGPVIEAEAVWRYLEPLEFDCPLHHDREAARRCGYPDIVVPATAMLSFALPRAWRPGQPFFDSPERNATPKVAALGGPLTGLEPPLTGFFAADYEVDFLGLAFVGDQLRRRGATLLRCDVKETRVGRGAFLTWQSEIVNQRDEVLARQRMTYFRYAPRQAT